MRKRKHTWNFRACVKDHLTIKSHSIFENLELYKDWPHFDLVGES